MSRSSEEVLEEAREHLAAGRAWRARDVLADRVAHERDDEALTLLGHVHHGMGDLPRAGVAWFTVGLKGPEADEAVAAWREQAQDDFAEMWRALPEPWRSEPRPARIEALRARALVTDPLLERPLAPLVQERTDADADDGDGENASGGGPDGATVIGWILGALFVACAVIGFVTVLGWVVPGG